MSYLFDYGEGLFCFVPVFTIIGFILFALIWNSLPSMTKKINKKVETPDGH